MLIARHRRRLAAGATALTFCVAGCGGGGSPAPSDEAKARSAVEGYLQAQVAGDGPAACALLSPAGRKQLIGVVAKAAQGLSTQPTCEDAVSLVRGAAGAELMAALEQARVQRVTVSGDRATATVAGAAAVSGRPVTLVRVGEDWLISGVPGLPG